VLNSCLLTTSTSNSTTTKGATASFKKRLADIGEKAMKRAFRNGNVSPSSDPKQLAFLLFAYPDLFSFLIQLTNKTSNSRFPVPINNISSFGGINNSGINYTTSLGTSSSAAVPAWRLDPYKLPSNQFYGQLERAYKYYSLAIGGNKQEVIEDSIKYMLTAGFIDPPDANFLKENIGLLYREAAVNNAYISTQIEQLKLRAEAEDKYLANLRTTKQREERNIPIFATQPGGGNNQGGQQA